MESREILVANLGALARHPQVLAAIREAPPYDDAAITQAKSGDPVLSLAGADGIVRPLHSRYEPRGEAARLLPKVDDPLATFLFLGAGLGYGPLEFASRWPLSHALVWVEPDARLFRTLLGRVDVTAVLARPQTFLAVGGGRETLFRLLHELSLLLFGAGVRLIVHAPSQQLDPQRYEEYRVSINEFFRQGAVRIRTAFYLSRLSLENQSRNLRYYVASPGIAPLAGLLQGRPAVIVAAGPSLRRNIEQLRDAVGKVTIIAVSTALQRLLSHGIRPDLTVLIDYHDVSRRYFEGLTPDQAPPMVVETKATPAGVSGYCGPHLFCNDLFFNTLFEGLFGDKGTLPASSTVAHAAFHVARFMEADPIVFVGQDLAYSGGFMHVPGTAIQTQVFPQTHRFYSMETRELEYYLTNRPTFTKVPGIPSGEVPTCDVFLTYLKEFELLFADHPGTVIDATEGGARMAGTKVEPLREVLSRYRDANRPDVARLIADAAARFDAGELRTRARERLTACAADLDLLRGIYQGMEAKLAEVIELNERGHAADALAREIQRLHRESQQYDRLYLVLSQLAQSDVWERTRQDRLLAANEAEGVERQLQQSRRDHAFIKGLVRASEYLANCLVTAGQWLDSVPGLEPTVEQATGGGS
ncbi:MAG: motility associated factor glycosyltransferase family protein [Planctomycetota bacterium]